MGLPLSSGVSSILGQGTTAGRSCRSETTVRLLRLLVAPSRRSVSIMSSSSSASSAKNKREVWRVHYALSKVRKNARKLLTLPEKHPKRIFEGSAMLRRLHRMGVMEEIKNKLDYVLSLKIHDFLERRLQTQVFKIGMAKSIHHARVLIRQRHIRVGKQIVNVPSFIVRTDSQKHVDFAINSPFGGGRPGRNKRKRVKAKAEKEAAGDGGEEEEEI